MWVNFGEKHKFSGFADILQHYAKTVFLIIIATNAEPSHWCRSRWDNQGVLEFKLCELEILDGISC